MDDHIRTNCTVVPSRIQNNFLVSAFKHVDEVINDKRRKYLDKVQSLLFALEQLAVLVADSSWELPPQEFESLFLHTLRFVFMPDWQGVSVATQTHMKVTLQRFVARLKNSKSNYTVLQQCLVLESVVQNPWSHPVLRKIFDNVEVDFFDSLGYFQFENGKVIVLRLEMMLEAQCEDLALRLAKSCLTTYNNSEPLELDFNQDELDYITDIYFCTLYRRKMKKELTTEIKLYELNEGLDLLRRYNRNGGVGKGFNQRCHQVRVWKCSDEVIELVANALLANAVLHDDLIYSETILPDLISEWARIYKQEGQHFSPISLEIIGKLVIVASASKCIYPFCSFLIENCICYEICFNHITKWLIRAISQNMNEIELCRVNHEFDKLKSAHEHLSDGFIMISQLFSDYRNIYRECLLTSFSLAPSLQSLQKLEDFVANSPCAVSACPQNISDLAKDIEPNNNMSVNADNPLAKETTPTCGDDPSLRGEVENLQMEESVKMDLSTILRYQRFRTLSWELEWNELKTICKKYLEVFEARGFNYEVELKYLELDYNQFKDKPINEEDYIGIEKGYEHFIETDDQLKIKNNSSDTSSMIDDTDEDEDYRVRKRKKRPRKPAKNTHSYKSWSSSNEYSDWENIMEAPGDTKMTVRRRKRKISVQNSDYESKSKKLPPTLSVTLDNSGCLNSLKIMKRSNGKLDDGAGVLKICVPRLRHNFGTSDVYENENSASIRPKSPVHGKRLTMRIRAADVSKRRSKRSKVVKTPTALDDELKSILNTFENEEISSPATYLRPSQLVKKSTPESVSTVVDEAVPTIKPIIIRRQVVEESGKKSSRNKSRKKSKKKMMYTTSQPLNTEVLNSCFVDSLSSLKPTVLLPRMDHEDPTKVPESTWSDELNNTDPWNPPSSPYDWDTKYTSLFLLCTNTTASQNILHYF